MSKKWLCYTAIAGLFSCSSEAPSELVWDVKFLCPEDAERAATLNLRVLADSCAGTDVVYETNLLRGGKAPTEVLSKGTYYFEVSAKDSMGIPITSECSEHMLPKTFIQFWLDSATCELDAPVGDSGVGNDGMDSGMLADAASSDTDGGTQAVSDAMTQPTCAIPAGNCTCASHGGHAYLFCPDAVTWTDARARCRAQNSDLVTIQDAAENTFLAQHGGGGRWIGASDSGNNGIAGDSCPGKCRKTGDEGTWKWISAPENQAKGMTFCEASEDSSACASSGGAFMAWTGGEPNNGGDIATCVIPWGPCGEGEDCAAMTAADGTWSDSKCDEEKPYICESF